MKKYTYIIYRDDKEIKRFTNQKNDFCVLKHFIDNTSQSMNYAFIHGGYSCNYFDESEPDKVINYV